MQNLSYQKLQFLFSSMSSLLLGVYTDKTSVKKLCFKDKGIELTGGTTASWTKQVTQDFVGKAVGLALTKLAPSSNTDFNYGIRVTSTKKHPGSVDNSEYWWKGKFYGGTFKYLDITSGYFSDANALSMENDIINQITQDSGRTLSDYGSPVEARRAYIVVDSDNTDASGFTVTWPDATTTVFVTAATFADGQLGLQANTKTTAAYGGAAFNDLLKVYWIASDTYIVTSINPGLLFTIGTLVDTSVTRREILLTSEMDIETLKDEIYQVEDDDSFVTKTGYHLADIKTSDAFATAINMHLVEGTTTNEITAGTNVATVGAAINAATTAVYASWKPTSGKEALYIGSVSTVVVDIHYPYINSAGTAPLAANTVNYSRLFTPNGRYSSLTGSDVYRIFAANDHHGKLSQLVPLRQADKDAEYVLFTLNSVISDHGAIHGASHRNSYKSTIQFAVPKASLRADLWDATGDLATPATFYETGVTSGFSADRTIDELLNFWKA